jgi:hypothetical protein
LTFLGTISIVEKKRVRKPVEVNLNACGASIQNSLVMASSFTEDYLVDKI